jgi:hypothetical protein
MLAQFTGPEKMGPERPLPDLLAQGPVNSPFGITLENNEKAGRGRIGRTLSRG